MPPNWLKSTLTLARSALLSARCFSFSACSRAVSASDPPPPWARLANAVRGMPSGISVAARSGSHTLLLVGIGLVAVGASDQARAASQTSAASLDLNRIIDQVDVLAKEFRLHRIHGWVSLHSTPAHDRIQARIRGLPVNADFFPVERGRFRIDWQTDSAPSSEGPFALNGDLPFGSFQLRLDVPAAWPDGLHIQAVAQTVGAFLERYRAAFSYGLHL